MLADAMERLGTETAFEVLARAGQLAAQGHDVINLGIGQPDFKTPEHIVEAGVQALRDGHHGYTEAQGILPLRESVSNKLYQRYGVEIDPGNVLIVPGGKVTMFMAILMMGQLGAEIIYPDPGFPIYRSMIQFTGARAVPMPLRESNGFGLDADELLSLVSDKTRLIIINSPSNPAGGITERDQFDKLAEGLRKYPDLIIMSDEIYDHMVYEGKEHVCMLGYPEFRDRTILLNGWSKTFAMTGWRLGYSVWPKSLIEHAKRLCVNDHSCVNAAAQYAGIAALDGPMDAVNEMVKTFDVRRDYIHKALNNIPGMTCVRPMGGFYAFPNITETGKPSQQIQKEFLEDLHVATISGTSFGEYGEGYIRFSYASDQTVIAKALERIGNYLSDLH